MERNPPLTPKEKVAVKFVQSLTKDLVSSGLAIHTLGCMLVFQSKSIGELQKYAFVCAALFYFIVSINTAAMANAIENNSLWLDASFIMAWLQTVFIICYGIVLTNLLAVNYDENVWGLAACAVVVFTFLWIKLLGHPKIMCPIYNFYDFHYARGGIPPPRDED